MFSADGAIFAVISNIIGHAGLIVTNIRTIVHQVADTFCLDTLSRHPTTTTKYLN